MPKRKEKRINNRDVPKYAGLHPHEWLAELVDLFTHISVYVTPERKRLARVDEFEKFMNAGELTEIAKGMCGNCIRSGCDVPDSVIDASIWILPSFEKTKSLTDGERADISKCLVELHRSHFRERELAFAYEYEDGSISLDTTGRWPTINTHGGGAPESEDKKKARAEYFRLRDDPTNARKNQTWFAKQIVKNVKKSDKSSYSEGTVKGYISDEWKDEYLAQSSSANK